MNMNEDFKENDTSCGCDTRHYYSKSYKLLLIVLLGFFMVGGSVIVGWYISQGLYKLRVDDRYVSVKGIAEQKVKADLAIWNINFKAAGDDLKQVSDKINSDRKTIIDFLIQNKIDAKAIEVGQTTVIDRNANEYVSDSAKAQGRYIINAALRIRSSDVDLIKQVSSLSDQLVAKGVIFLKEESYSGANPCYLFTKLDSIRPGMLETATQSARLMGEQFAKNSGSKLGKIKHANQGVFQILNPDTSSAASQGGGFGEAGSIDKQIRVITSIDYFLVE